MRIGLRLRCVNPGLHENHIIIQRCAEKAGLRPLAAHRCCALVPHVFHVNCGLSDGFEDSARAKGVEAT